MQATAAFQRGSPVANASRYTAVHMPRRRYLRLSQQQQQQQLRTLAPPTAQAVDSLQEEPVRRRSPSPIPAEEILLSPMEPQVEALEPPTAVTAVLEDSCHLLVEGKDKVVRNWDAAMGLPSEEVPYRNLCSMVEQVALLQHHGRRFAAADGLAMYLAICMLAELYDEGGLVSGPMTPSKKVHELSDALIEAFLGTWLEERVVFERWLDEACTSAGGLVHISWAQPSLPTPVRCYLMGQLELKLLESRRSKPTRNEYDRKLQRFRLWYNRRCIWLNLPGLMFSMNGSELAGFVHGAEVVEQRHLATVVHSSTLWPPQQTPPQRVKRTVVVYLMQSFSGQGKGVGRSIVHALREGGVSCQDPTNQKLGQQQHPLAQDPTIQKLELEPLGEDSTSRKQEQQQQPLAQASREPQTDLDRLTSIQILQQLLDERALGRPPAAQQKQQQEQRRGQQETAQRHVYGKNDRDGYRDGNEFGKSNRNGCSGENAGPQGFCSRSSSAADHSDSGKGSGEEWLVLADAPMENARPFWHKMGVPVAIESSYARDAWVDLGWHSTDNVRLGEEPGYTPGS